MDHQPGDWRHSLDRDQPCQIIATETLWGQTLCQVWLPGSGRTARFPADRLTDLQLHPKPGPRDPLHELIFIATAARIVDTLSNAPLAAPLEGSVIPLPHQLQVLERALAGDKVRFLLADEVGLGKTIEAGLILRELKRRDLIRRVLVVAPAGLVSQWVSEMKTHFNEDFRLVLPNHLTTLRQAMSLADHDNPWCHYDQVVCPLDSVKPVERRRGWTADKIRQYNRDRFTNLVCAGWDLIIIDEVHRLGGSSKQVARHKLGEALAQAAPYLLILSATPHQGKTDAFCRLIRFLDPDAAPSDDRITREQVAPYVIRTEKRHAIDASGNPLFKPRTTTLRTVAWGESHESHRALYESVTRYVQFGYNLARQSKQNAIGFLMILMQRLVTSSTAAIRSALERRLAVLEQPTAQQTIFDDDDLPDDWEALDAQEQCEFLMDARFKGLKQERDWVEQLLNRARTCEALRPDAKAEALLEEIHQRRRDENHNPKLKFLIFTEFVATQTMLDAFLTQRGFSVVRLNGSMSLEERREAQNRFAADAEILVSTDAGGEGLNLQFCHIVINYDLPWNPMKLEQRIGRVDRIGQQHPVQAFNMVLEDTVELRVREVLEEKLQRILDEFGIDKLSDVLDSEEAGASFEDLYIQAMLSPEEAEQRAAALAEDIRCRAAENRQRAALLGSQAALDPTLASEIDEIPIAVWTEAMVVSYLRARPNSFALTSDDLVYRLIWPDGHDIQNMVFYSFLVDRYPGVTLLSLHDERVRKLLDELPVHAPGQPIYAVIVPNVSDKVSGFWSLWRIRPNSCDNRYQRIIAVFISDEGRQFVPTAERIWGSMEYFAESTELEMAKPQAGGDALMDKEGKEYPYAVPVTGAAALEAYQASRRAAEEQGASIYAELIKVQQQWFDRELKSMIASADSSRTVRDKFEGEIGIAGYQWFERMKVVFDRKKNVIPELTALLLLRIERESPA